MALKKKDQIRAFLKAIETGDAAAVEVVNEEKYIQHNPHTHEGSEGLAVLFKRLSKTEPRVNIVRAFEDGDFVFAHTEYDFSTEEIGFEVFRFEDGRAVEHWDNLQSRQGPNPAGRSMVDGPTEAEDPARTEANRDTVRSFVGEVFVGRQLDRLEGYFDGERLVQHDPEIGDGLPSWRAALEAMHDGAPRLRYDCIHRVLAEGNFVLCVSEGFLAGVHSSFYDLFRLEAGKLVEHWNTIEAVPPRAEWKNDNGKF